MKEKILTDLLFDAIACGDFGRVSDLLSTGANPNVLREPDHALAPLHVAASLGNVAIVHTLIDAGAVVDMPDGSGLTPLGHAVCGAHLPVVELLLKLGANPNAHSPLGTVLSRAAEKGYTEIVKALVAAGAQLNGEFGAEPLRRATVRGYFDVVQFLLDHEEVNIDAPDEHCGNTALHLALIAARLDIADLLIRKGADVNKTNANGETPVQLAKQCRFNLLASLAKRGISPHALCSQAVQNLNKIGVCTEIELSLRTAASIISNAIDSVYASLRAAGLSELELPRADSVAQTLFDRVEIDKAMGGIKWREGFRELLKYV